jgi:hypothetical protein
MFFKTIHKQFKTQCFLKHRTHSSSLYHIKTFFQTKLKIKKINKNQVKGSRLPNLYYFAVCLQFELFRHHLKIIQS